MKPALLMVAAYLLGSIPFGYLIVRSRIGADVRTIGSGGTGATNVSRSAGKRAGVLTLVLDALKGAAAIAVVKIGLGLPILSQGPVEGVSGAVSWWLALAAVFAILGHIFPIWLGFRGGKGVATGVGVFLMLAPLAVVLAALVFAVIVGLTRYVSLGSIVAAAAIPLFLFLQNIFIQPVAAPVPLLTAAITGALLIIFAHRGNIGRLIQGTESKFR